MAVGAHPGYADRANFGRVETGISPAEIAELTWGQLDLLSNLATAQGVRLTHVKAHGALYARLAKDESALRAFAETVALVQEDALLYLPAGPRYARLVRVLSDVRVRPVAEAFPDRAYLGEGSLAPRRMPGALITDPQKVAARALLMARGQPVMTIDGDSITLEASTLCLHGDNPSAVECARLVSSTLRSAGIRVAGLS